MVEIAGWTKMRKADVPPHVRRAFEFVKAGERIAAGRARHGGPQASATAWLLEFVQADFSALSAGGLSDRVAEVVRFSFDGGHLFTFPPSVAGRSQQPAIPLHGLKVQPVADELELLVELQRTVRGSVQDYVRTGRGRFPHIGVTLEVRKSWRSVAVEAENITAGFFYHAAHLLGAFGHRVRQCRECTRLFLAGRSDREFCSGRCQVARWKRTHPRERRTQGSGRTDGAGREKGGQRHGKRERREGRRPRRRVQGR